MKSVFQMRKIFLCSVVSILIAGTAHQAAAQSITFSPVEKPLLLPSGVQPSSNVTADNSGNIFFANSNNEITKVSTSGAVTTISSGLTLPDDVKTDAAGNVYAADNGTNELIKITPAGVQSVVASGLNLGLDIEGLTFDFRDFAVDASGNIFISDNQGDQVLKVSPSGAQTVLASGFSAQNIAIDAADNVYVSDDTNNRVVKISPSGSQTVLATGLHSPADIVVDASGNVFVIDSQTNCCVNLEILKITPLGTKTTVFAEAGEGSPGLGLDGAGNLYFGLLEIKNTTTALGALTMGDSFPVSGGSAVQPITFTFNSTVAVGNIQVLTNGARNQDFQSVSGGTCAAGTFTSGETCTVNAQFLATQAGPRLGAVVLSDPAGNTLSTVNLGGVGFLAAGALTPGLLENVLNSGLSDPSAVAVDGVGNTFIVDKGHSRVVKISASGVQSTVGNDLASPTGVAEDGAGNIYISDTAHDRVVKVTPSGDQTAVLAGLNTPEGVAVDGAGNLYVADAGNDRVLKLAVDGATQSTVGSGYARPTGVTVDGVGDVFVADFGNNQIVEVTPNGAQSTVIGNLSSPSGVALDARGDLYVAEVGTNQVIEVSGSQITTIAAGLNFPFDAVLVAVNGTGNVFVADTLNNRVLQVDRSQSNLNFGTVTVGQSVTGTVTVNAIGQENFSLGQGSAIKLDANDKNFVLLQDPSANVDCMETDLVRSSCTLKVEFKPTAKGSLTGTVTINDSVGTLVVHLSGTGN